MFTGIIEEVGRVRAVARYGGGRRLSVAAERVLAGLEPGDSIALDGACQTVVACEPGGFVVEAIGTTLSRTILRDYDQGRPVNLERALALGERLGGHLLQGHVDGVGPVTAVEPRDEHVLLEVRVPAVVAEVTVLHGSIAINGVSLTIHAIPAPDTIQVALVPFTQEHTNLTELRPGAAVNLEGDLIGKFVIHHLNRSGTPGNR